MKEAKAMGLSPALSIGHCRILSSWCAASPEPRLGPGPREHLSSTDNELGFIVLGSRTDQGPQINEKATRYVSVEY